MPEKADTWREDVFLEQVPPVGDRQHYRLMHRKHGTVITYVHESITPDRALFCARCGDIDCYHCHMVQALVEENEVRDAGVFCAYCRNHMAGEYGTTLDPEFDATNVLVHVACKALYERKTRREAHGECHGRP